MRIVFGGYQIVAAGIDSARVLWNTMIVGAGNDSVLWSIMIVVVDFQ